VALLRTFERAAARLDPRIRVLACDASPFSSAFQAATGGAIAPRCTDAVFVPWMIEFCRQHQVRLIVPTIDTELPVLSAAKEQFAQSGIDVCVSAPATVAIGGDKALTHEWLTRHGFPTVHQATSTAARTADLKWPLFAKPRFGSASVGIRRLSDPEDLRLLDPRVEYIVQEVADGREFTIDVFVSNGKCIVAVPRERIEVRAGEVSKSVTRRLPALEDLAMRIAESLPGASGPLNIQVFVASDLSMKVIEINARFGGGFPLSWEAGAEFSLWVMEHAFGFPPTAHGDWLANLVMLRYDDAVFVNEGALRE
jgi:carbamoyl-phosphate synthase large subunit